MYHIKKSSYIKYSEYLYENIEGDDMYFAKFLQSQICAY